MLSKSSTIEKYLLYLSTSILLLDRPIQYLLETLFNLTLSTNQALVAMVALFLLFRKLVIPLNWQWLTVFSTCYIMLIWGTIRIVEFPDYYFNGAISIAFSFTLGLFFASTLNKNRQLYRGLLLIATVPSTLSVLSIVFGVLPTIDQTYEVNRVTIARPEIFTDQNFHVMYTFWLTPLLFLLKKRWELLVWIILVAINVYTLSRLQTRSGIIYLSITFLIVIAKVDFKHHQKVLIPLGLALIFLALLFADKITTAFMSSDVFLRFTEYTLANGEHRISSFTYWIEHLLDFKYWLPYGNSEFNILVGTQPHSNPTAFYLSGGIVALLCFFILFAYPALHAAKNYIVIKDKGPLLFLSICVVIIFCIQLSLTLPYNEQIWFWCGVGIYLINLPLQNTSKPENISEIKPSNPYDNL